MTYAVYEQATGLFTIFDVSDGGVERCLYECEGHSGRDRGRDNPEFQHVRGVGPIPVGMWRCRLRQHERFRRPAFKLDPMPGTLPLGRSGFWIHGGTVSHGCILLSLPAREAVEHYNVSTVEVVPASPGTLRLPNGAVVPGEPRRTNSNHP